MTTLAPFEPARHLTKVGGAEYLEVKWRLVWLRDVHPDAVIESELVRHEGDSALFRARISLPSGGSATGWGSEEMDDFRDYIEKAETKAIGRALAALGFGTQFCPDFDFGAAVGRVVDAPIDFASSHGRRTAATPDRRLASVDQPITERQLRYIRGIAREAGMSDAELDNETERLSGKAIADLGRRDASALIERLQARRAGAEMAS